mmetsp:Transcript_29123/g.61890  ORF Transcript_29123/g.61890 Transcript_29123/m.61890 type:complete len:673 (+) Transcript_29123:108-2126(+)
MTHAIADAFFTPRSSAGPCKIPDDEDDEDVGLDVCKMNTGSTIVPYSDEENISDCGSDYGMLDSDDDEQSTTGRTTSGNRSASASASGKASVDEQTELEEVQQAELEEVQQVFAVPRLVLPPGLNEVAEVPPPPLGSLMHGTGQCIPCVWHWKPQGCQRGLDCGYCHLCPEGEVKVRKKAKMLALRAASVGGSESAVAADAPWVAEAPLVPDTVTTTSMQELVPPPPLPFEAASAVPSVGSAMHASGGCRPCAWFWKPTGCQNGAECRHCHICPEGEVKARKKVKANIAREEKRQLDEAHAKVSEMAQEVSVVAQRSAIDSLGESPDDLFTAMLPPPGLAEPIDAPMNVLPSLGSVLHSTGQCKPCAWFWKPQGCQNGKDCHHCHLCPKDEIKARKKEKLDALRVEQKEATSLRNPQREEPVLPCGLQREQAEAVQQPRKEKEATSFRGPGMPPLARLAAFGGLPSPGSALHGTGMCKPCGWFWRPGGCGNGKECRHCHLCPEGEIKARRKMKLAVLRSFQQRQQEVLQELMESDDEDEEQEVRPQQEVQEEAPVEDCQRLFQPTAPMLLPPYLPAPPPPFVSMGSTMHFLGQCKPGAELCLPEVCQNGTVRKDATARSTIALSPSLAPPLTPPSALMAGAMAAAQAARAAAAASQVAQPPRILRLAASLGA